MNHGHGIKKKKKKKKINCFSLTSMTMFFSR